MQNKSAASLRKRRRKLLSEIPPLDRIMRGSLIERYKRCGRPGCHCANERGHGPKLYLSVSIPGGRPHRVPEKALWLDRRAAGRSRSMARRIQSEQAAPGTLVLWQNANADLP